MGTSEIKILQKELTNKMSYKVVKHLTRAEYFVHAKSILSWVNDYKQNGLSQIEMKHILNYIYNSQIDYIENDEIFEGRFEALYNELFGNSDGLYFWTDDINIYIKKWDNEIYNNPYIK